MLKKPPHLPAAAALGAALCVFAAQLVHALSPQKPAPDPNLSAEAAAVVRLWQAQARTTDFDRWLADQLQFYAIECSGRAKIGLPHVLRTAKLSGAGSWRAPQNDGESIAVCKALVRAGEQGALKPVCASMNSQQPPFAFPRAGLPGNYAFLVREIRNGERVTVGGYCWLVNGEPASRQFYAGPATVRLLGSPEMTELQTASGVQRVRTSSIAFEVQGLPQSSAPVLAVWP